MNTTTRNNPALRLRPLVMYGLGTLLLIFNAFFGTYAYVVVQAFAWTHTTIPRGPIVLLFALVVLNLPLRRLGRRFALTQAELLALYAMIMIGAGVAGASFVQFLVNQMAAPFYYATAANGWQERLWPHIPGWLAPRDLDVINGFYRGNARFYEPSVMAGWMIPVLAWSAFVIALFWVLLCASALIRRQWIEAERLSFPLVLLPLQMTEESSGTNSTISFWKNRWMWAGFALAGLLESFNFINFLYPWFPGLPLKPVGPNQLDAVLTIRPWSETGMLRLAFYPFAIGIGYLVAVDVLFSCWFLYLCTRLANVAVAAWGLSGGGGGGGPADRAPFLREQGAGAFIGIALFSLWMARAALARAWAEAVRPTGGDKNELMSFRLAFWGGGIGLLFLIGFLIAAGLPPSVAALFVGVFAAFSIALARIVSDAGGVTVNGPFWSPTQLTGDFFGSSSLSAREITVLYGYTAWPSFMTDNPLPPQVQSLKMSQQAGFAPRALLGPLVWAIVLGTLCAFWAHLDIYYTHGAASAKVRPWLASSASSPAKVAAAALLNPRPPDVTGLLAALAGALIAVGMWVLRLQLPWWPLHPLGYALANTDSMQYIWCPFLIAWIAKRLTLRYGGIRAYRAALPFFLGLILGDFVIPTLWGIFGMATGYQQYMTFPH